MNYNEIARNHFWLRNLLSSDLREYFRIASRDLQNNHGLSKKRHGSECIAVELRNYASIYCLYMSKLV